MIRWFYLLGIEIRLVDLQPGPLILPGQYSGNTAIDPCSALHHNNGLLRLRNSTTSVQRNNVYILFRTDFSVISNAHRAHCYLPGCWTIVTLSMCLLTSRKGTGREGLILRRGLTVWALAKRWDRVRRPRLSVAGHIGNNTTICSHTRLP